jgi:P4 family phage/plasmid primase-like protien
MIVHDDGTTSNARVLDPDEQIKAYYQFGYKVLVLGDKNPYNPYRADGLEWQKEHVQQETALEHAAKGGNIGLQMGAVSDWLCAVDLDTPEVRKLAPQFLPSTLMAGKEGEDAPSHYVYRSEGADYLGVKDIGAKELLSLKAAGEGQGHQIKVAPSVHPEKGRYVWMPAFSPPAIRDVGSETLIAAVRRLSAAGLIRKYLPDEGRHEYSKAIAGTLLRRGYDADELAGTMRIVWADAGAPRDGVRNASKNVLDTARALEDDKRFTGGTTLNGMVPGLAEALVKAAGLDRNQAFGAEEGENGGSPADDSDLARLWLYKRKGVRYSPHGWLRYENGWWRIVDEGLVTQDMLKLMDRTPGKVSANRLKSVSTLARYHSYVKGEAWDANKDIIVCTNGTLDLNTFQLRDHRPEDRALGGLPFDYDPEAKAEAWNEFIGARLQPGEWEFLQEFVGYSLTTDCSHELAVWLVGEGGTGKSTFVEGVQAIAGNRAAGLSLTDLERSPFALENFVGKTLLTATEQPGTFIRYVDLLNKIISGEEIQINRKNKPILDVRSTAKILWAMNRTPQIREEGSGFFRRIHPITFHPFEGKKNPGIKERIVRLEGPGILAWAVEGLKRLRERDAFEVPDTVKDAMEGFELNNDPAAQFLNELCEKGEDYSTSFPELHEVYTAWCKLYGYKAKAKNTASEDWRRLKVGEGRSKKARYWKLRIDKESETYKRLNLRSDRLPGLDN